ncbi:hypothetical protein RLM10_00530, partial [Streptococcus pneumoniae]|nr:hypothetical protein [Streptococcus pneumoniae]
KKAVKNSGRPIVPPHKPIYYYSFLSNPGLYCHKRHISGENVIFYKNKVMFLQNNTCFQFFLIGLGTVRAS